MTRTWIRAYSRLLLALYFARHLLLTALRAVGARLGVRGESGLARFRRLYADDRLRTLGADELVDLGRRHACIRCGLCDRARLEDDAPFLGIVGPSMVASTLERSVPDQPFAADYLAALDAAPGWEHAARACPTGVRLERAAAAVRAGITAEDVLAAGRKTSR